MVWMLRNRQEAGTMKTQPHHNFFTLSLDWQCMWCCIICLEWEKAEKANTISQYMRLFFNKWIKAFRNALVSYCQQQTHHFSSLTAEYVCNAGGVSLFRHAKVALRPSVSNNCCIFTCAGFYSSWKYASVLLVIYILHGNSEAHFSLWYKSWAKAGNDGLVFLVFQTKAVQSKERPPVCTMCMWQWSCSGPKCEQYTKMFYTTKSKLDFVLTEQNGTQIYAKKQTCFL